MFVIPFSFLQPVTEIGLGVRACYSVSSVTLMTLQPPVWS